MVESRGNKSTAVTGMGCCCAAGQNVPETLAALKMGMVNCHPVPPDQFPTQLLCPVFSYQHALPSANALRLLEQSSYAWQPSRLNRTVLLALEALAEVLQDAGLDLQNLRTLKVGIAVGTTVGCTFHDEEYYINWRQGNQPETDPVLQYLESNLAVFLQTVLGVRGPVAVVTNACASGTDAIGIASRWLEQGLCDIAIAGGADALSRIAYYGFNSLMLLSQTPCTPFDKGRAGLNLGEGAAFLVMEHRKRTTPTKNRTRAWIHGYGAASDCYHPTAPHPDGRGLQSAIKQALAEGNIELDSVRYINAHGTGTKANDSAEMKALASLGLTDCPVVSTKGITGHMLGAAGAIEAIFTIAALSEQQTPGTVNCRSVDPDLAFAPLKGSEQASLTGRIGISQSLAFGGTNSALVLEANAS